LLLQRTIVDFVLNVRLAIFGQNTVSKEDSPFSPQGNTMQSKYVQQTLLAIAAVCVACGTLECNSPVGSTSQSIDPVPQLALQHDKAMVLVPSKNSSFVISDPVLDSVRMTLTYNFWIDTAEVTQGDFHSIMDSVYPWFKIHSMFLKYGSGDLYPVFGISWNHAALYCNEKSKRAGLDTVYSYAAITLDTSWFDTFPDPIIAVYLPGIKTNFNSKGFRMPTEAEWMFACRGNSTSEYYWGQDPDSATSYSWTSTNSNRKVNKVCMKHPNQFGIYDMIGNLAEYCNDFYSTFAGKDLIDPIGGTDSTYIVEKGGTFQSSVQQCGLSTRNKTNRESASSNEGFRAVRKM
jgi:formylglycine-generating enzyme required for sulfatase activity